jgi:uroporphyrinogen-III synthase
MRMLVTRPEPDAGETAARLEALGIETLVVPLLERAALHTALPAAHQLAALALTSANALRALEERGALKAFRSLPVFAVGEHTAAAASDAGFRRVTVAGGTLSHLAAEIEASGIRGPVFYPAARHQSGDLAAALKAFGVETVVARVYEMRARATLPAETLAALGTDAIGAALFYSRRTAETFVALAGTLAPAARRSFGVLCLAEPVAAPLLAVGFSRVALADAPNEDAMMTLALAFARDQNTA